MDELDGVPCSVLGYQITTRTQICLSCCVSAVCELLVYAVVVAADVGVIVQHCRDGRTTFAALTALWLVLPAVVSFVAVVASPWQWPADSDADINDDDDESLCNCGRAQARFFVRQLANLLFFPVAAIYR